MDFELYGSEDDQAMRSGMVPPDADVLLAADVVYDVSATKSLAKTVWRFLQDGTNRIAIFATTVRNRNTFHAFEEALNELGISKSYETQDNLASVPRFLPAFHLHPRSGMRVCSFTISTSEVGLGCQRAIKNTAKN
uniref:Calmodulin-lysine N-methyltransferase n=1 Tax=Cyclophora tenuis TaxID=216820 RepID=A0A7S1D5U4_CYCTE